jgi:hypothetical protein
MTPLPGVHGSFGDIALAPDGRRVALVLIDKEQYSVVVRNVETGLDTPIVGARESPIGELTWTPDGRRVLFAMQEGFLGVVATAAADGSEPPRTLVHEARHPARVARRKDARFRQRRTRADADQVDPA